MKWTLKTDGTHKRVWTKTVKGVEVEKVEHYGNHARSAYRVDALGTPARVRWATLCFRALGDYFHRWDEVMEAIEEGKKA